MKAKEKTEAAPADEVDKKIAAMEKMTAISFRTRQMQKKKAEKIFADMGISMSAALNMFLAQVVRDKGMPFMPTTQKREIPGRAKHEEDSENAGYIALEELWEEL